MNTSQINGTALNGPSSKGANALLAGGLAAMSILSAALVSGAVLAGGLESSPDAGGRVSKSLDGGIYSGSLVDGRQFKTANLQLGIFSGCGIGSNIGLADGLTGGVASGIDLGGQIVAGAVLRTADTVADISMLGGGIGYDAWLAGGIDSTSYTSGNVVGSTVMFGDGIKSDSALDGDLNYGRVLGGGTDSTSTPGGNWFYDAHLSGGVFSLSDIFQGLSISPRLQDGMVSVAVAGSPVMRISAELDDGIGSSAVFNAQIIVSPNSNYGVDSGAAVYGEYRIGAVLTGGAGCASVVDGVALRAAQRLQGGISASGLLSAGRMIGCAMNGNASSDATFSSNLISGARLHSYVFADTALAADLRIGAVLTGHAESTHAVGSALTVFNNFTGGIASDAALGAGLLVNPSLTDGVSSGNSAGGDIAQGFRDPLLNTWALEILSATPILEIETPLQDN